MTNIVARLREREEREEGPFFGPDRLCYEAAAEIERLRDELKSECERRDEIITTTTKLWKDAEAALAEAREVIRPLFPIKDHTHQSNGHRVQIFSYDTDGEEWGVGSCTVGDLRRLASWLERNP